MECENIQPVLQAVDENDAIVRKEKAPKYESMCGPDGHRGMKIEARNLSFKYPKAKDYALRNVNFVVQPGQTLAIVGFNGGGKTTLTMLLMRLLDYEGSLLINDIEARRYHPADLHDHMSACFQDHAKFPLSLRENICLGDNDPTRLAGALVTGGVDTFLGELEDGLETMLSLEPQRVDVGGAAKSNSESNIKTEHNLSGGQWQRVALARCFYKASLSDLVVLDEPSSALDARAEDLLFDRIRKLSLGESGKRERTTIFITHRFSTVRHADCIAVFEGGTITEFGDHTQLMRNEKGVYHEFYTRQASAFN